MVSHRWAIAAAAAALAAAHPADAPPPCCAMHRTGDLHSNVTMYAAQDGKVGRTGGTIAFDASHRCALFSMGCCEQGSGVLIYPCPSAAGRGGDAASPLCGTAWCGASKQCKDFRLPARAGTPRACVGGGAGSMYPAFQRTSHVDALITKDTWASRDGRHEVHVNRLTCMPVHAADNMNYGGGGVPLGGWLPEVAWAHLSALTGGGVGASDDDWALTAFENTTATAPPSSVFSLPDYCSASPFKKGACGGGAVA